MRRITGYALSSILLMVSTVCAFDYGYSIASLDPADQPPLSVTLELAQLGVATRMPLFPVFGDLLHAEVEYYHVRAGLSLIDGFYGPVYTFLPVSVGYTVYERPVHYSDRLYGRVPEVYVKATARFVNWYVDPPPSYPFIGTLEAVGAIDCYGVGLSASIGLYYEVNGAYAPHPAVHHVDPFASAKIHLPMLRLGY
jgi:hypothetical protein